jgi:hypothetical protein
MSPALRLTHSHGGFVEFADPVLNPPRAAIAPQTPSFRRQSQRLAQFCGRLMERLHSANFASQLSAFKFQVSFLFPSL